MTFYRSLILGLLTMSTLAFSQLALSKERVLVAGATGGTGRLVVAELVKQGYEVRAMVRDEAKGKQVLGEQIPLVKADVTDPATLPAAVRGVDVVICTIGASLKGKGKTSPEAIDYVGTAALIDAAQAGGVKKFILTTSGGVTWWLHPLNWFGGNVLKWKRKAEQHLRDSSMTHVILRPAGGLTDEEANSKPIEWSQSDGIPSSISRGDVAIALVEALKHKSAENKTFEIKEDDDGKRVRDIDWQAVFGSMKVESDNF